MPKICPSKQKQNPGTNPIVPLAQKRKKGHVPQKCPSLLTFYELKVMFCRNSRGTCPSKDVPGELKKRPKAWKNNRKKNI